MKRFRLWLIILLILLVSATASWPAAGEDGASLGGDDLWWDGFAPPGAIGSADNILSGEVVAAVVHEGSLVISGRFRYLDGVPVPGLARWTGETWEPLDVTGLPWDVSELVVYDGRLVAGGSYTQTNEEAESCLYRQTDTGWEPFGPDSLRVADTSVPRLKVAGNRLYVLASRPRLIDSPYFSQHYIIARWDGTSWEDLPIWDHLDGDGQGYDIIFDIDEYRGDPVVAGSFYLNEGDTTGHVARWTGSDLQLLAGGTDRSIYCLAVHEDRLIAGGLFSHAGSVDTGPLASWDGRSWAVLGERLSVGEGGFARVNFLQISGDDLLICGNVDHIGVTPTGPVASWNGTAWSPTPPDSAHVIHPWPAFVISTENGLIYGGTFDYDRIRYSGLARLDNTEWRPFPPRGIELCGSPGRTRATDEGLIVAGEFTLPERLGTTLGLARWDGTAWTLLAEGFDDAIYALTEYRGHLVAGGAFESIGGVEARHIALLHDGRWRQIGNGFDDDVFALAVYEGELIAGGIFTRAGTRDTDRIAAWNGLSWRPLGKGIQGNDRDLVWDLEVYGGALYAGGHFYWADDTWADNVARWDGRTWSRVGPLDVFGGDWYYRPWVSQLVSWNGQLVAGGHFETVEGDSASSLAIWNGENWSPLLPLLRGEPDFLGVHHGRLVVGGPIARQGETFFESGSLLAYDGTTWMTLGSGLSVGLGSRGSAGRVTSIQAWRESLYVIGLFHVAGGKPSSFIARWDGATLAPPRFDRLRAAPNPATDAATLHYRLDGPGPVSIHVFDVRGRRVATLREGFMTGGDHTETWDLRDGHGRRVPVGVYFLRVDSPLSHAAEKIVVIR